MASRPENSMDVIYINELLHINLHIRNNTTAVVPLISEYSPNIEHINIDPGSKYIQH